MQIHITYTKTPTPYTYTHATVNHKFRRTSANDEDIVEAGGEGVARGVTHSDDVEAAGVSLHMLDGT